MRERRRHRHMRAIIIGVGMAVTIVVAISTQLAFPPSNDWRTALYVLLGVIVTLVVADTADVVQQKIQGVQLEIRDFLMERVNSRHERTEAVIELCKSATHEFRAVTLFPVVGIQDDPETAPGDYLRAVEEALQNEAKVTLVSMSCDEAKQYCESRKLSDQSMRALNWVDERLAGLVNRFPHRLEVITVPGDTITVNVCHNDSTALLYHVGLQDDDGAGFRSTDARVVAVAKGGVARYTRFNGDLPEAEEG
jgi:hypothetical protein